MGGNYTQDPFETFWDKRGPITALAAYDASTSWVVDIRAQACKTVLVKNSGASPLTWKILASLDNAEEFDYELKAEAPIAAGNQELYAFTVHYTHIKMMVKGVGGIATIKVTASGN